MATLALLPTRREGRRPTFPALFTIGLRCALVFVDPRLGAPLTYDIRFAMRWHAVAVVSIKKDLPTSENCGTRERTAPKRFAEIAA